MNKKSIKFLKTLTLLLLGNVSLFGESAQEQSLPTPVKAVTPSARTCSDLNGFYVTGDFIYWKAREDDLIFFAQVDLNQNAAVTTTNFHPIQLDFQHDPGFKLGVGGDLPYDGWDLYVNWIHFHTVPTVSISSATPNIEDIENEQTEILFLGRSYKQSWNLMFNSLDFEWGRRFFLSETLTVRPSLGGKAVWIRQKIRGDVHGVEQIGTGATGSPEVFRAKISTWGIGPYCAFESKWTWGWGLGLFGELSGALLWGKYTGTSFFNENQSSGPGGTPSSFNVSSSFTTHRVRPTVQSFIGLDWEWCFIKNWLSVNFRIGYEIQYFWSQIINIIEDVEESDLTFDGLTFTGRIDF